MIIDTRELYHFHTTWRFWLFYQSERDFASSQATKKTWKLLQFCMFTSSVVGTLQCQGWFSSEWTGTASGPVVSMTTASSSVSQWRTVRQGEGRTGSKNQGWHEDWLRMYRCIVSQQIKLTCFSKSRVLKRHRVVRWFMVYPCTVCTGLYFYIDLIRTEIFPQVTQ